MATIASFTELDVEKARAAYDERGVALFVPQFGAIFKHRGSDCLDLLHRLTTNSVIDLQDGSARQTILTNEKGRIVDVVWVLQRSADELLLISDAPDPSMTSQWIDGYTIIEDAELSDCSDALARWNIVGPEATSTLARLFFESDFPSAEMGTIRQLNPIQNGFACALRTDSAGVVTWSVICDSSASTEVLTGLETVGLRPAPSQLFDQVRIENQIPAAGHELTLDVNPLEAGLMHLIDFDKGCYIGQEVIARLDTYDKVQRTLVGFSQVIEGIDSPSVEVHDRIRTGDVGRDLGWVTSVVATPSDGQVIGLAYVRKSHAQPDVQLTTSGGSKIKVLPNPR